MACRRLLWIDDEIAPDEPAILALNLEGYRVDCALTGAAGLNFATTRHYNAIILDLRLPDMPGLAVLARLNAAHLASSVLVLTGFGDVDAAYMAGSYGAGAFKTKPLFIDDLSAALGKLIDDTASSRWNIDQSLDAEFASVAAVLEHLEALMRSRPTARIHETDRALDPHEDPVGLKRGLVTALMRAACDPTLPVPCFLACARALKRSIASGSDEAPQMLAELATVEIVQALPRSKSSEPRVTATIAKLSADVASGYRPTEEEIGHGLNVDPSHLGRLIYAETGLRFREWRLGFVMKASVHFLSSGDEHVKQIACRLLGFAQETQFDREFRQLFGLTPSEFRRAWKHYINQQGSPSILSAR